MSDAVRPPLIIVRDLHHVYPGNVEALKGVTLVVHDGEVLGIIGQNGSGKTTLVKHFNGLLKPSAGEVLVLGESTQKKRVSELARHVGYVFQNPDQQFFLTSVEKEIGYGPANIGMPNEERERVTSESLERLGLSAKRLEHPFQLTRNYRKLLSIACVLAMKPRVVVFDEPTTGQDMSQVRLITNAMRDLSVSGHTLVIISHDMALVAEHCSRVIVMNEGQVMVEGAPGEVFSQPSMLARSGLEPPDITQIAARSGIGQDILSVKEMADYLDRRIQDRR